MARSKNPITRVMDGFVPPQSQDVEREVLGAVLIYSEIMYEIAADFTVDLFFNEQNRLIASSIIDLFIKSSPINILTVSEDLKNKQQIDLAGGNYYISQLTTAVIRASHIETHIKILQQYFLARHIVSTCHAGIHKLFLEEHDTFDVYDEIQVNLESGLKDIIKYEMMDASSIHKQTIIENMAKAKAGVVSGVMTGFTNVDRLTNGMQKSDLVILAGRSGMGKTSIALCLALNPAISNNTPVAVFSLEMSRRQVIGRLQSILSGYNVAKVIKNQLTEEEWLDLAEKSKILERAPIFIDDSPSLTLTELKIKARKLVREKKVEMIVIDYLQLLRSGKNFSNREQEVAEISKGLKVIAKELDIPIIALSQLSRDVEKRGGDKKPGLADLRESGQIEQDADMVLFCYRPEYYGITEYYVDNESIDVKNLFMLIVAKHRNGDIGELKLSFIPEQTKVVNHNEFQTELSLYNTNALQKNTNFDLENTNVLPLSSTPDDNMPF